MYSWQPIETAPKDGKPVDLWIVYTNSLGPQGERAENCRWFEIRLKEKIGTTKFMWCSYIPQSDEWVGINEPTHWMRVGAPE
jgi:hypothetical protein